jgi:hypothetical protein
MSITHTYSECMSIGLMIQHAPSVACLAVPSLTNFVINGTNFELRLQNIKCVVGYSIQHFF